MLPPAVVEASAKCSSHHLRSACKTLLSEGHGPGVGVTEELKPPPPLPANAKDEDKKRRNRTLLRHELLTVKLALPYRKGGLAVRTPDRDMHASYLAGRAELMMHLRKYSVPWQRAIVRWHTDAGSTERKAIHEAYNALAADSKDGKAPIPDVAMLLKTEKLTPSALMSAVDDHLLDRAETLCSKLGEEGHKMWADMRSCSSKYAHAPFTAPLTPRPLCDDATFVAMLRIRVGLSLGWPTRAMCPCQKEVITTQHAMVCPFTPMYQMRHNALLLVMMELVRRAGATARSEPMARPWAVKRGKDRLDIDVTYGDVRLMLDVTVAATCRADVRKMALAAITPGCATKQVIRQKTNHYKATVEAQGKELQIIAFDSAGCPAPTTLVYLERWIKAATPEPDSNGIFESQHSWRAHIARAVLQAQAKAVTSLRRQLAHGPFAA